MKKKRKLTTDCDNPTTKKENIYKKQKLDNLQDQKAATPQKPQKVQKKEIPPQRQLKNSWKVSNLKTKLASKKHPPTQNT